MRVPTFKKSICKIQILVLSRKINPRPNFKFMFLTKSSDNLTKSKSLGEGFNLFVELNIKLLLGSIKVVSENEWAILQRRGNFQKVILESLKN
ncbi:hypothetical protein LEP1GSC008_4204 [Leptospira kirschneri serovar Bulgarica str. Nikolaevo]|uniref:Uncharacterized protein n=1 Tax=Leptospira kirschneri serovar Bulgarica str. Nikolaevo TaxID=1240687 RepID=M6F7F6_9LEPT|nr:hypothetical protein LEP1GSC008_4204 [Leptospira kirschneri serovar Bulgarica str. Nikolaevo]